MIGRIPNLKKFLPHISSISFFPPLIMFLLLKEEKRKKRKNKRKSQREYIGLKGVERGKKNIKRYWISYDMLKTRNGGLKLFSSRSEHDKKKW